MAAAEGGHPEVAEILLREGADVTVQDEVCIFCAACLSSAVVPTVCVEWL